MRSLAIAGVVACSSSGPRVTVPAPPPQALPVTAETGSAAPPPVEVPKLRLPRNFTPTGYTARLAIDPEHPAFTGWIAIAGAIHERSTVIWLHGRNLAVQRASAGGRELVVTPRGTDLLELDSAAAFEPGDLTIELDYTGTLDDVSNAGAFRQRTGDRPYAYTQFEALFARRVFPCIDEPDAKVPWQLTLDIPAGDDAFSNTPVESETALPSGGKRVAFARTAPLPSYLVAFGIGVFDVVPAGTTKSGVPIRIVVPKGRARAADYAAAHMVPIVEALEAWFGTKFPFPKLDVITIPLTTGFGAMENAGLITMTERLALLDAKPSFDRRETFLRVAGHETAHQWFGDLVTMVWWDDIWLNEGFARWMEQKVVPALEPSWHFDGAQLDARARAMHADELTTARRIRQPIDVQADILNVFDGITYDKGASVLNMFETYVGADVFQRGVRAYLAARAGGNATSNDFVAALGKAAGKDLAPAFATFLEQAGVAELDVTCDRGTLTIAQHRFVPPGAMQPPATQPWQLPVCVAYANGGKRAETCTLVTAATGSLSLGATCPAWVMPSVAGRGYYALRSSPEQIIALRDRAWPQLSWAERRVVFHDVVQATRAARAGATPDHVPLALALSLVPKLLAGDRFAVEDARQFVDGLDPLVPDPARAKFEAWIRATFGPALDRIGMLPRERDDIDAELTRVSLYHATAYLGRDPRLVARSVALAAKWRELPDAIRGDVLRVAVDADAAAFARAASEVKTERDRDHRHDLYVALGSVRDPQRYQQALSLVLDPAVDTRESYAILTRAATNATRALAQRFVRDRDAELAQRMPQSSTGNLLIETVELFSRSCDPATHDDSVAFMTEHLAKRPGGERIVRNAVERLDECIATRASLDAELRAWLK